MRALGIGALVAAAPVAAILITTSAPWGLGCILLAVLVGAGLGALEEAAHRAWRRRKMRDRTIELGYVREWTIAGEHVHSTSREIARRVAERRRARLP